MTERVEQQRAPPRVLARDARGVTLEQSPLAEPMDARLEERARVQVRELLGGGEPLHHGRRRQQPAQPEPGAQALREGADVDDNALAIAGLQGTGRAGSAIEAGDEPAPAARE